MTSTRWHFGLWWVRKKSQLCHQITFRARFNVLRLKNFHFGPQMAFWTCFSGLRLKKPSWSHFQCFIWFFGHFSSVFDLNPIQMALKMNPSGYKIKFFWYLIENDATGVAHVSLSIPWKSLNPKESKKSMGNHNCSGFRAFKLQKLTQLEPKPIPIAFQRKIPVTARRRTQKPRNKIAVCFTPLTQQQCDPLWKTLCNPIQPSAQCFAAHLQ